MAEKEVARSRGETKEERRESRALFLHPSEQRGKGTEVNLERDMGNREGKTGKTDRYGRGFSNIMKMKKLQHGVHKTLSLRILEGLNRFLSFTAKNIKIINYIFLFCFIADKVGFLFRKCCSWSLIKLC